MASAAPNTINLDVSTHAHEADFDILLETMQTRVDVAFGGKEPIFTTDAADLFSAFLDHLPEDRQAHVCHACRHFVERFGALVVITDEGASHPLFWEASSSPAFYQIAVSAMEKIVKKARVTGVFLPDQQVWGQPHTGIWTHFSARIPEASLFRHSLKSSHQKKASYRERYGTVGRALADFTPKMLSEARHLLETQSLDQSDRYIGPVNWLQVLHEKRSVAQSRHRDNILWKAVAQAPEGFCHPRTSVVGSLLEDIAANLPFEVVKSKFAAKVDPKFYQRPQAAPTQGNIERAEEIFAKLGLAPALERRYASVDELRPFWTPKVVADEATKGGIFSHLLPPVESKTAKIEVPPIVMTWDKFNRTVLPSADQIEFMVPLIGNFIAFTTAVHADAPPILRWDREDDRNPLAWFVQLGGSPASRWKLKHGRWQKVVAATTLPPLWTAPELQHSYSGVALILEGTVDTQDTNTALFPECLREELREVRSTIEAHSKVTPMQCKGWAAAVGYDLRAGNSYDCLVRVFSNDRWTRYKIDRWD